MSLKKKSSDKAIPQLSPIKRGPGRPRKDATLNVAGAPTDAAATSLTNKVNPQLSPTKRGPGRSKKDATCNVEGATTSDAVSTTPANTSLLHSLSDIEARLSSQITSLISSALAPLKALVSTQHSVLTSRIDSLESNLNHLVEDIDSIVSQKVEQAVNLLQQNNSLSTDYSPPVSTSQSHCPTPKPTSSNSTNANRKFNLIVYGVPECPKGTPWTTRACRDLNSVSSVVSSIDGSVTKSSIRDCYRLGKYSESNKRSRPILVELHRSHDVSIILSKRSKLQGSSTFIKPDMSQAEKATEKILLNQRWQLIQAGKTNIKIRGPRLYINGRLHGQVVDSQFLTQPLLSDHISPLLDTLSSYNVSTAVETPATPVINANTADETPTSPAGDSD